MTEREYIVETFRKNFSGYSKANIALYGIGSGTGHIVDEFREYNIAGLLDGFKTEGEIYGKKILSLSDLPGLKTDAVIIVARSSSVRIIYNRISEFCREHSIPVFDLNGIELCHDEAAGAREDEYFQLNKDSLKAAIREHEIISFDIFGTLLQRKVLFPEDVFYIIEAKANLQKINFARLRIEAQRDLYRHSNPTLDDIYQLIGLNTGISGNEKNCLLDLELTVEKEVTVCRQKMRELLDFAVSSGKRVYLISDMYLSKRIIDDLLRASGIEGYEDIFVSCQYGTGKLQDLYSIFRDKVKGKSYLHIGDDKEADGLYATMHGIDSVLIKNPADILEISTCSDLLKHSDTTGKRIRAGMLAAELFNDPFCLYNSGGRPGVGSAYKFGYAFVAPLMTDFILWLVESLKNKGFEKVIFTARDGYLVKRLYDKAVEVLKRPKEGGSEKRPKEGDGGSGLPESAYLLFSRSAGIAASIETDEDIVYASQLAFDGSPAELLKKRFHLEDDEIAAYDAGRFGDVAGYALFHRDNIRKKAETLRKGFLEYMGSLGLRPDEKTAFFDFVSTGTCQMCLEKIVSMHFEGRYFIRLFEDYDKKRQLDIKSFYECGGSLEVSSNASDNYFLLESLIKAAEPSVSHFGPQGKPVFQRESRTAEQLSCIHEVQSAIEDYFENYLNITGNHLLHSERDFSDKILGYIQNRYTSVDVDCMNNLIVRDEFCNRQINTGSYFGA